MSRNFFGLRKAMMNSYYEEIIGKPNKHRDYMLIDSIRTRLNILKDQLVNGDIV